MHDEISSQVTTAAVAVMFIQWLKASRLFPWITLETDKLNKLIGALVAGLSAAGIIATYDHTSHTLTIANLTLMNVAGFGWHAAQSFVYQQLIYHGMLKKSEAPVAPAPTPAANPPS